METPSTATPKDPVEVLQSTAGGSEPAPAALLTHSSIGLALFDAALHCTWANDALEQYDAIPRIKRLGRRPETALSGGVASYARFSVLHGAVAGPAIEDDRSTLEAIHGAYDMEAHFRDGSPQSEFLTAEVIDAFGIVGPAEHCLEQLQRLVHRRGPARP